ncbi:hypothetical protein L7F22_058347 [Adiantum nelumboides]|nr:hypothetical protein [Adiantum nelumboides]
MASIFSTRSVSIEKQLIDGCIFQPYNFSELPASPAPAVAAPHPSSPNSESCSLPSTPSLPSAAADTSTSSSSTSAPLWQQLWADQTSEELKAQALNTVFIKGVEKGTLDPQLFGKYTVQDAVYCGKIAHLWLNLSNNSNADEHLQDLAREMRGKYLKAAEGLFQWWQIEYNVSNDEYGVWLGEHAKKYVEMVEESVKENPAYMLVANFPCIKLWHFLASTLEPKQPSNNIYAFWIEAYKREGSSVALLQDAIEKYAETLNYATALQLFHKGMQCEIDFFNKP